MMREYKRSMAAQSLAGLNKLLLEATFLEVSMVVRVH
jgi:hypothetical protein